MKIESNVIEIGGWVLRQRIPDGDDSQRLMLLLHGWTGDENSMWIFTHRLPENYILISPRGLYQTPLGGYGWRDNGIKRWPTMNDFQPARQALIDLIDSLDFPGNQSKRINVMGFSQGAALAYSLALTYPERVDKLAGISGFFPEIENGSPLDGALKGKKVFVAHGLRDEMVPVDKARQVVETLKQSGADVIYCEEDVGHKLSSGCFRGLDDYFGTENQ